MKDTRFGENNNVERLQLLFSQLVRGMPGRATAMNEAMEKIGVYICGRLYDTIDADGLPPWVTEVALVRVQEYLHSRTIVGIQHVVGIVGDQPIPADEIVTVIMERLGLLIGHTTDVLEAVSVDATLLAQVQESLNHHCTHTAREQLAAIIDRAEQESDSHEEEQMDERE